jgi:pyruvate ferredoxin oxidoreductase delta subunit
MNERSWKEMPIGGLILEAGNAVEYRTGDWRSRRPIVDREKCSDCLLCWIHCPDLSVKAEEEKMRGFDYLHCKGCGICASVCPKGAIHMENEEEGE